MAPCDFSDKLPYAWQNTGRNVHRCMHIDTLTRLRQREFLQPSIGFFVLLHVDFSSSSFPPSFSYSVQFPAAALLSLSFSLLHLSFLTHSQGVRFLQLVHISAPISRTPLPLFLSLSLSAPLLSFVLSLLLYLMLTSACPGWPFGPSMSREGWVDSHSLM